MRIVKKFEDFKIDENLIKRGIAKVKNVVSDFFADEPTFDELGDKARQEVRKHIEEELGKISEDAVELFKKSYETRLDLKDKQLRGLLKKVYDSDKLAKFLESAGMEFVRNCLANKTNDLVDMPMDVFPAIMSGAKTDAGESMFSDKVKNQFVMDWVKRQKFYHG